MKNLNVLSMVVVIIVLVIGFSSCTKEENREEINNVAIFNGEQVEYNTPYSVRGVTTMKIYLSENEQYDRVSLRTGYNSFADTDGGYYFIQNDTLFVTVDKNWTVAKFQLQNGTTAKVNVEVIR